MTEINDIEKEIVEFWKKDNTFEKSLKKKAPHLRGLFDLFLSFY